MDERLSAPTVSPVSTAITRVAVAPAAAATQSGGLTDGALVHPHTDRLAVASAICGMTAIIPVISQLAGLALGIASLVRIRRARRTGAEVRGTGWALTGIISSGFALLGWVAMVAALLVASSIFSHATDSIHAVVAAPS